MSLSFRPLPESFRTLVDYMAGRYRSVVEIGIGPYPDVALALSARGLHVRATDLCPRPGSGLSVFRDDVTVPTLSVYRGAELLYSLRPPGELFIYLQKLAFRLGADLIIKPLASEAPPGRPVQLGKSFFYFWNYFSKPEKFGIGEISKVFYGNPGRIAGHESHAS